MFRLRIPTVWKSCFSHFQRGISFSESDKWGSKIWKHKYRIHLKNQNLLFQFSKRLVIINFVFRHFCVQNLGSILSTKKILRILTISKDFQNVFLSKYSEENFEKSDQPLHQNILSENFSDFLKKIGGFKILRFLSQNFSELRFLLIVLSHGHFVWILDSFKKLNIIE